VTVSDQQTSLQRTATSDSSGFYLVTNLPPGSYRIRVEHTGFKTWEQSDLQLNAGDRLSVNPDLQLGAVSETVTVAATGEKVETDNGSVGQLIDGNQARDLSLNGRNLMTLLMIVPGVAVTTDIFDRGGMTYGSIGTYNINGLRSTSNSVTVDGGYNQDSGNITSLTNNVSVDFVGEVKIASSAYSAEYGRTGGAQVNFATRRGTSEYHGTLWEFFRNDKLNSRGFFSPVPRQNSIHLYFQQLRSSFS
jgi:Carboxypeptidase regulatory-like domain/TonB-dependent Receptor Plug Domain